VCPQYVQDKLTFNVYIKGISHEEEEGSGDDDETAAGFK
jgi:hypothetical protein